MANDIDREVLILYLKDLCTMENIIYQTNKRIERLNDIEKKMNFEFERLRYTPPNYPREPSPPVERLLHSDGFLEVTLNILCLIVGIMFSCTLILLYPGLPMIVSAVENLIDISKNSELERINRTNHEKYMRECQIYRSMCVQLQQEHNNKIQSLSNQLKDFKSTQTPLIQNMQSQVKEYHKLLSEAYSANIIPLPFRNINGVMYLYNYLSSSTQSLSEALIQANLEEIKSHISILIDSFNSMIEEQIKMNESLRIISAQNQQMISIAHENLTYNKKNYRTMSEIREFNEQCAQYSKISAENSALIAELSNEQLAYQKADYFINHVLKA